MVRTLKMEEKINNVISYANARLITWYKNAKEYHGIIGEGRTIYNKDKNEIEIHYSEDGIECIFSMGFLSIIEESVNYLFDVWSECASVEDDRKI